MNDEIWTCKEVCEYLRIHYSTLVRLAKRGKIPYFKIGADYRFRRDQIEKWTGAEDHTNGK